MLKTSKHLEIDADKLLVKEKSETPDYAHETELETFEALRTRGLAYAFSDIIQWETHERYLVMLFGHMRRDAPANYCKPTLQQVLRADRAVFAKLIQEDVPVRRDAANNQPVSDALVPALNSCDVGFHLIPLPKPPLVLLKPEPARQSQPSYTAHRNTPYQTGKGKGKTKNKGKGRGAANILPKALQGRDNVSTDIHNRRLCFGYNIQHCPHAKAGEECRNGWHLCSRRNCQAPHEHDAQAGSKN